MYHIHISKIYMVCIHIYISIYQTSLPHVLLMMAFLREYIFFDNSNNILIYLLYIYKLKIRFIKYLLETQRNHTDFALTFS